MRHDANSPSACITVLMMLPDMVFALVDAKGCESIRFITHLPISRMFTIAYREVLLLRSSTRRSHLVFSNRNSDIPTDTSTSDAHAKDDASDRAVLQCTCHGTPISIRPPPCHILVDYSTCSTVLRPIVTQCFAD